MQSVPRNIDDLSHKRRTETICVTLLSSYTWKYTNRKMNKINMQNSGMNAFMEKCLFGEECTITNKKYNNTKEIHLAVILSLGRFLINKS